MTLVGSVDLARGARLWSDLDDSLAAAVRLDIGEVPAYGRVARVPLARVAAVPCGSEAGGARADVGCRCTERAEGSGWTAVTGWSARVPITRPAGDRCGHGIAPAVGSAGGVSIPW